MWKQVLDFDLRVENRATPVKGIVEGRSFQSAARRHGGVACVGRGLAWVAAGDGESVCIRTAGLGPESDAGSKLGDEWIRQTIGTDPVVVKTVETMLMQSWPAYEHYTGFWALRR